MYGFSVWSLLLILAIVVVLFGTRKLRSVGSDLGGAIRGFKSAMNEGEKDSDTARPEVTEERASEEGKDADAKASQRQGENDRGG